MKRLSIRTAKPSERDALEALQWRASLGNAADREDLLAHPDAIALPPGQIDAGNVWVAERDGDILGFAAVLQRPDGQIELDGLFVGPDFQRQGIGRMLVERCAAYAAARGASILHVIGNPHAKDFYAACGFICEGTEKTRFGEGLVLRRDLSVTGRPSP